VNKQEIVAAMSDITGMSKADSTRNLDAFIEVVGEALMKGDEVRLVGFAVFSVAARAASEGRDPRTGKPIKIEASKRVKIKAGKGLKDLVNQSKSKSPAKKKKASA
jgi:DNA-binding protein HU-beta